MITEIFTLGKREAIRKLSCSESDSQLNSYNPFLTIEILLPVPMAKGFHEYFVYMVPALMAVTRGAFVDVLALALREADSKMGVKYANILLAKTTARDPMGKELGVSRRAKRPQRKFIKSAGGGWESWVQASYTDMQCKFSEADMESQSLSLAVRGLQDLGLP